MGGAKDFFPNFPKPAQNIVVQLLRPFFGETSKRWSSLVFLQTLGGIFRSQQDLAPFSPRLEEICPNLRRFCSIFQGICSDFQQIKVFGVRAPPFCQAPPASYTTVNDGYYILLNSFSFIIDEVQNIHIVVKSNNVLQLPTRISFKTNHIQSYLCNKRFNASHESLLFAIHNSIDT